MTVLRPLMMKRECVFNTVVTKYLIELMKLAFLLGVGPSDTLELQRLESVDNEEVFGV
jgi:hypothetical protein